MNNADRKIIDMEGNLYWENRVYELKQDLAEVRNAGGFISTIQHDINVAVSNLEMTYAA